MQAPEELVMLRLFQVLCQFTTLSLEWYNYLQVRKSIEYRALVQVEKLQAQNRVNKRKSFWTTTKGSHAISGHFKRKQVSGLVVLKPNSNNVMTEDFLFFCSQLEFDLLVSEKNFIVSISAIFQNTYCVILLF